MNIDIISRTKISLKNILFICVLLSSNILVAQSQDKYQKGFVLPVNAQERINAPQNLLKIRFSKAPSIPAYIDNSKSKFFPKIFNQKGPSCGQASGVGYTYTYELNSILNREANTTKNVISYMYTWNYVNGGRGWGSWPVQGWDIIKENGAISEADFHTNSFTEWANGYDKYYKGMAYGVEKISFIKVESDPDLAIRTLKQYLVDHGDGSKYGGCIGFTAMADPLPGNKNYKGPSHTNYKCVIEYFPVTGAHAMTIAGYDDKVECDVNRNGYIEAEERGAFICVNSWGSSWGDNGRFYMPYQLVRNGNRRGGCDPVFYTVRAKQNNTKLVYKIKMEHSSRDDLSFELGLSNNLTDKEPKYVIKKKKIMYKQAGDIQMRGLRGSSYKVFEFGLDASELASKMEEGDESKFFLNINSIQKGQAGFGKLISFSVLDYRKDKNNPKEYVFLENNQKLESYNSFSLSEIIYDYENMNGISFKVMDPENKTEKIYLKLKNEEKVKIEIIEPISKNRTIVFDETMKSGSYAKSWSLEEFTPGVYALRVITYNQIFYKKIIIK